MSIFKRKKIAGEEPISEDKSAHRRSVGVRYVQRLVLLFFCFLVLLVLINSVVMPFITRHGEEFSLPNLVGMGLAQAEQVLRAAGLKLEVTSEEYHADKPSGTILSQFPAKGTLVKSGRTIKVVISLGRKDVVVPDLHGFSISQARVSLEEAGFTVGNMEWTVADSLPEKVVVFSYPSAGAIIPYGSTVNLLVNRGASQKTILVPRLIGLSLTEAKTQLEEKGLKVGQITRFLDENFLPETVLKQSEEPGTELLPGEEVDLIVSRTD